MPDAATIQTKLREPFAIDDIGWVPLVVKGNRAMACAYIDARTVMRRLDEVVGVGGWQDECTLLPEGVVQCRLSLLIDGVWVAKTDVGSPSEQPDGGDRAKAAVSDALKRAAVKFGVGRYLYDLGQQWVDYDPVKKYFIETPTLPAWAIPKSPPEPEADPGHKDALAKLLAALEAAKAREALTREAWVAKLHEYEVTGKDALEQLSTQQCLEVTEWLTELAAPEPAASF